MDKNLEVAYSTDYAGESQLIDDLKNTLKKIKEVGFSHIHWCHEWNGDYTYSIYEMLQIKGWMNDLGLQCKGIHASDGLKILFTEEEFLNRITTSDRRDFTSFNELNRLAAVELIKNRIDMASVLGTDCIVLHMHLPFRQFEKSTDFKEKYFIQAYKTFDELESYAVSKSIKVCIENMCGIPNKYQIEKLDTLFNRYSSKYLGFCFDTGHSLTTGEECLELVNRYKNRLFMLHLSDNHGIENGFYQSDEHLNPYQGIFNWDGLAKIVASSEYTLPVVLEVSMRDREEQDFMKESLAAGTKFTERVLTYQNNN